MKKEVKVKIKFEEGHVVDGILTREKVLENYHELIKLGHKESDEGFYNGLFYWCEGYIEHEIDDDDWGYAHKSEEKKVISFIRQVVEEEKQTSK